MDKLKNDNYEIMMYLSVLAGMINKNTPNLIKNQTFPSSEQKISKILIQKQNEDVYSTLKAIEILNEEVNSKKP